MSSKTPANEAATPPEDPGPKPSLCSFLSKYFTLSTHHKYAKGLELLEFLEANPEIIYKCDDINEVVEQLIFNFIKSQGPEEVVIGFQALEYIATALGGRYTFYGETVLKKIRFALGNVQEFVRENARAYLVTVVKVGAETPCKMVKLLTPLTLLSSPVNKNLSTESVRAIVEILKISKGKPIARDTLVGLLKAQIHRTNMSREVTLIMMNIVRRLGKKFVLNELVKEYSRPASLDKREDIRLKSRIHSLIEEVEFYYSPPDTEESNNEPDFAAALVSITDSMNKLSLDTIQEEEKRTSTKEISKPQTPLSTEATGAIQKRPSLESAPLRVFPSSESFAPVRSVATRSDIDMRVLLDCEAHRQYLSRDTSPEGGEQDTISETATVCQQYMWEEEGVAQDQGPYTTDTEASQYTEESNNEPELASKPQTPLSTEATGAIQKRPSLESAPLRVFPSSESFAPVRSVATRSDIDMRVLLDCEAHRQYLSRDTSPEGGEQDTISETATVCQQYMWEEEGVAQDQGPYTTDTEASQYTEESNNEPELASKPQSPLSTEATGAIRKRPSLESAPLRVFPSSESFAPVRSVATRSDIDMRVLLDCEAHRQYLSRDTSPEGGEQDTISETATVCQQYMWEEEGVAQDQGPYTTRDPAASQYTEESNNEPELASKPQTPLSTEATGAIQKRPSLESSPPRDSLTLRYFDSVRLIASMSDIETGKLLDCEAHREYLSRDTAQEEEEEVAQDKGPYTTRDLFSSKFNLEESGCEKERADRVKKLVKMGAETPSRMVKILTPLTKLSSPCNEDASIESLRAIWELLNISKGKPIARDTLVGLLKAQIHVTNTSVDREVTLIMMEIVRRLGKKFVLNELVKEYSRPALLDKKKNMRLKRRIHSLIEEVETYYSPPDTEESNNEPDLAAKPQTPLSTEATGAIQKKPALESSPPRDSLTLRYFDSVRLIASMSDIETGKLLDCEAHREYLSRDTAQEEEEEVAQDKGPYTTRDLFASKFNLEESGCEKERADRVKKLVKMGAETPSRMVKILTPLTKLSSPCNEDASIESLRAIWELLNISKGKPIARDTLVGLLKAQIHVTNTSVDREVTLIMMEIVRRLGKKFVLNELVKEYSRPALLDKKKNMRLKRRIHSLIEEVETYYSPPDTEESNNEPDLAAKPQTPLSTEATGAIQKKPALESSPPRDSLTLRYFDSVRLIASMSDIETGKLLDCEAHREYLSRDTAQEEEEEVAQDKGPYTTRDLFASKFNLEESGCEKERADRVKKLVKMGAETPSRMVKILTPLTKLSSPCNEDASIESLRAIWELLNISKRKPIARDTLVGLLKAQIHVTNTSVDREVTLIMMEIVRRLGKKFVLNELVKEYSRPASLHKKEDMRLKRRIHSLIEEVETYYSPPDTEESNDELDLAAKPQTPLSTEPTGAIQKRPALESSPPRDSLTLRYFDSVRLIASMSDIETRVLLDCEAHLEYLSRDTAQEEEEGVAQDKGPYTTRDPAASQYTEESNNEPDLAAKPQTPLSTEPTGAIQKRPALEGASLTDFHTLESFAPVRLVRSMSDIDIRVLLDCEAPREYLSRDTAQEEEEEVAQDQGPYATRDPAASQYTEESNNEPDLAAKPQTPLSTEPTGAIQKKPALESSPPRVFHSSDSFAPVRGIRSRSNIDMRVLLECEAHRQYLSRDTAQEGEKEMSQDQGPYTIRPSAAYKYRPRSTDSYGPISGGFEDQRPILSRIRQSPVRSCPGTPALYCFPEKQPHVVRKEVRRMNRALSLSQRISPDPYHINRETTGEPAHYFDDVPHWVGKRATRSVCLMCGSMTPKFCKTCPGHPALHPVYCFEQFHTLPKK